MDAPVLDLGKGGAEAHQFVLDEEGHHLRQAHLFLLTIGEAGHVLALDVAGFLNPSLKAATRWANSAADPLSRKPITGTGCCARAAIGHAAAAPPSSVMNSRRLTQSPRRRGPPPSAGS